VIDACVKAYRTVELDRVARVEQLSDAELVRIAKGIRDEGEQRVPLLIVNQR
jgi:hypothetical protein